MAKERRGGKVRYIRKGGTWKGMENDMPKTSASVPKISSENAAMPELIGSEKQVKWAKDVLQSGLDTLNNNYQNTLAMQKEYPHIDYSKQLEVWRDISEQYTKAGFGADKQIKASMIIENRNRLDGGGVLGAFKTEMSRRGIKEQVVYSGIRGKK